MDSLEMSQARVESHKTRREDSDEREEDNEEEGVFQLQQECRMTSILQEALYKCDQVITLLAER